MVNINMDECISNLVVSTDSYVVHPVENIPIPMVDANYESVGIAHLVSTSHHSHAGQVIRFTPASHSAKSAELHPLEAEIQRDLELKHQQQQQQLSRQHNTSVIHSVPEAALQAVVRRTSPYIHIPQKPMEMSHAPVPVLDDAIQLPQIVHSSKNDLQKVSNDKSDQITLPHYIHAGRQMVLQGKQYILVSESAPLISTSKNQPIEMIRDLSEEIIDMPEASQIPLTVQNYNCTEEVTTESNRNLKVKQESDSEDEGEEMEPVYDYEPDPESSPKDKAIEDMEKPNKCYMCFKSFRQKKNMYAHIRKIHSAQPKIDGGILCPLCKMHALRQEHLRNHLETLHDIHIEKEEKMFNSMKEFLLWKEFVEGETLSLYVSKSSAKLLANNQQKTYYKCHRSGNYVSVKKENRKKRLKAQGSNKIGATCPAAMEVTENVHGVTVTFWKTHVGHDNDLAHLVLSKEDRAKITECLNAGVPWDSVLEKIKQEAEKAPNVPSRLTMISKQDLRNMKRTHDIKACPDLFGARKKVSQGRKPMKERMLRRATQSLVIEKAELLLNLLETTDVIPEFRPKVCIMIDNLMSTVKRRAVKDVHRRESIHKKRRKEQAKFKKWAKRNEPSEDDDFLAEQANGDSRTGNEWMNILPCSGRETNGNNESSRDSTSDTEKSVATQTVDLEAESSQKTVIKSPKKRGRPKKCVVELLQKPKQTRSVIKKVKSDQ